MRTLSIAGYTAAGAAAGAASAGLGAVILHPAAPDQVDRLESLAAGFIGGAAIHAALGIAAATEVHRPLGERLIHLGASLTLMAGTSAAAGAVLLGAAGEPLKMHKGWLVAASLVGAGILGSVGTLGVVISYLGCHKPRAWTQVRHGDLGAGEALLGGEHEASSSRHHP